MKTLLISLLSLILFNTADAQLPGHTISNIKIYFSDLNEEDKWDFGGNYRFSFYVCADNLEKLSATQEELAQLGFCNFKIVPNSVSENGSTRMLNMLIFEKTTAYNPEILLNDINALYSIEQSFELSSFDDYGNYEFAEAIKPEQQMASRNTWNF